VDALVARAMAKPAGERFQSAEELRDALIAARAGHGVAPPARALFRRRWFRAAAIVAIALAVVTAASRWRRGPAPHPAAPIAILPAVSAGDPGLETLGVGLVSMLRDNLASAPGLTVVSTAGLAPPFRGAGRDLAAAARELGAGYLVDLRISGSAERVKVRGALIEAGQTAPLWDGSYEGDPLSVHRWVSEQVAGRLETLGIVPRSLSKADRLRLRRLPTASAAAFAAYSQGQARLDAARGSPDVEAAIASLQDAVTRDSGFALARAALSQACARMYGYTSDEAWIARASAEATQALATDPDRSQVHYSLAMVYQDTGRIADALQHAQEAVRLSPASDEAHRLLGTLLASRGETDKAVAELNVAIRLRPNYARNQATLGYVLYKAARYRQAVEPYRRATDLQPTAANFAALGTALHASGNVQEAIGNYKHAVELGGNPRAYSNLAFSYYTAGRFDEALANWQEAIKLDKAPPPVRFRNLGDAYERLGRHAEARSAYTEAIARAERLLKVNPGDVEQIATIAVCEAKLGRKDEAALRAAEALGLKPADSDVLFKAAVVDALGGRHDSALARLQQALAAGYPRAFARDDFDLQRLRNDPRFAALVAQRDE
jgi:tetratricopeptide (TPR) repeat protein